MSYASCAKMDVLAPLPPPSPSWGLFVNCTLVCFKSVRSACDCLMKVKKSILHAVQFLECCSLQQQRLGTPGVDGVGLSNKCHFHYQPRFPSKFNVGWHYQICSLSCLKCPSFKDTCCWGYIMWRHIMNDLTRCFPNCDSIVNRQYWFVETIQSRQPFREFCNLVNLQFNTSCCMAWTQKAHPE